MTSLHVEKHKWDGSVSAVSEAVRVDAPDDAVAWFVRAGTVRDHSRVIVDAENGTLTIRSEPLAAAA